MTGENNCATGKSTVELVKKSWMKPVITPIEPKKIRQEEVELYYRMMDDPNLFRLMENSGPT